MPPYEDFFHAMDKVVNNSERYQRSGWPSAEWVILMSNQGDMEPILALKTASNGNQVYRPSDEDMFTVDWQPVK